MKETEKCSREELEAFIGIEAKKPFFSKVLDKYMKNPNTQNWNFGAFFLGPFYLMYRKCYIPALIVSIAYFTLIFSNAKYISLLLLLVIMILLGLFGTNIYMHHAEKEINILREYNYMKSPSEFEKVLSAKGGTSFAGAAILYFAFAILMWTIIFNI